jgi:hypothetical protein
MIQKILSIAALGALLLPVPAMLPTADHPATPVAGAVVDDTLRTDFNDYLWPTDARRKMTSSFAEFRRTHFHGGIDVGTGSTTGYKVFAMRDGYVSRIIVSPNGYGKMLYVRHRDGYSSTYAHLSAFNAALTERVAREQRRQECYAVEIACLPGEFPVNKGDLIAFTGETGVGTPHLHFEIRDPNDDFVNPLLGDGLRVDDTVPPQVRRIAVRPLDETSRIDGAWAPRIYGVRRASHGTLAIEGTIHVTGRAGIAVEARDLTDGSGFRHGLYGYDLYLDSRLIHRHRLDRAPSNAAQQIMLYYDWDLLAQGRGRYEKLYPPEAHDLAFFRHGDAESGIITTADLAPGEHALRIDAFDFSGNRTEVSGTMVCNHPPAFTVAQSDSEYRITFPPQEDISRFQLSMKRRGAGEWRVKTLFPDSISRTRGFTLPHPGPAVGVIQIVAENSLGTRSAPRFLWFGENSGPPAPLHLAYDIEREFVRVEVTTPGDFTAPPSVFVYEGGGRRPVTLEPVTVNRYAGAFRPLASFAGTRRIVAQAGVNGRESSTNGEFELFPLVAGSSGSLSIDGGNLVLAYGPTSLYSTEFLRVTREMHGGEIMYHLSPENITLRDGLTVTVRSPIAGPRVGLFARGLGGGDELLAAGVERPGDPITGTMKRTVGDILVAVDDSPPSISALHVAAGRSALPRITFRYGDGLAGVDYSEFKMYIDGQVAVPEIDGEHRRAYHRVTDPLPRGPHLLLIRIKDRLGNVSEVERRFTVR